MRVVLDTNIFISAMLGGTLGIIVDQWKAGKFTLIVTPEEEINIIAADVTDNKFLEAAVAGKANLIVSGDGHLLELKSFRSIPIITAREFIAQLEKE